MTNREFYNFVIEANLSDELTAFAQNAIEKLDNRNAVRSSKPSKVAVANEPIKVAIVNYLYDHAKSVASDIAVALELSTQKASALCRQLVEAGLVTVEEIKVPKKGKMKAYSAVEMTAEVDE